MADLPVSTTATSNKIFEICGLDYFRFVLYVESCCTRKTYDLIFTCVASCAIHVEIATSLTSKAFCLRSLIFVVKSRLFILIMAQRFKLMRKSYLNFLFHEAYRNRFCEKGDLWQFIPWYTPQQGGMWEAMVKHFAKDFGYFEPLA